MPTISKATHDIHGVHTANLRHIPIVFTVGRCEPSFDDFFKHQLTQPEGLRFCVEV